MRSVSPQALRSMLLDGGELALIDLREELIFADAHLLWARSIALSRLELRAARLVPRRGTRIVFCDDDDGLCERAESVLIAAGYTDVAKLAGGNGAWRNAGYELFSGVNVPSKAFGEFVEHAYATPSIAADDLARLIDERADIVVLDSRPYDEYRRVSIPTATNVPGAELVLRARDLAPSPATTVVVNCAGRTRSILGAQSLINARLPNPVVALRNGTMGYSLAGFSCERECDRRYGPSSREAQAWAMQTAHRIKQRCGIAAIDAATLDAWRSDSVRTLFVFDVRDPDEYRDGHVAGAISAPGGQLIQATDNYAGTLGARIVLVDDKDVRAVMTASWLRQMGWQDVAVFSGSGTEIAATPVQVLGPAPPAEARIDCAQLAAMMQNDATTIVDLSLSTAYRKGHIPGAWFAIRSRLAQALRAIATHDTIVLTSEDGLLAGLTAAEASAATGKPVFWLDGGNAAWAAAGGPMSTAPRMADDPVDCWVKPYERGGDTTAAMNEYLAWETDLLPRIARDGTFRFRALLAEAPDSH